MIQSSRKEIVFVSLMLFSMFFGAGNLIFPPFLGQSAGEHVWLSMAGFILFASAFPLVSYKMWVVILCIASMAIANMGLTQILAVSVPILGAIYPIAIVLIALALIDSDRKRWSAVYFSTVLFTALFSFANLINVTFLASQWSEMLGKMPLYAEGVGWIVPAIIGFIIGVLITFVRRSGKPLKEHTA